VRPAGALSPVVPGDPFLLLAVDLDIGRVQIDRRASGDELCPTLLTERGKTSADELAYRSFHVGEDRAVEAAREADERRRGRDLRNRAQR